MILILKSKMIQVDKQKSWFLSLNLSFDQIGHKFWGSKQVKIDDVIYGRYLTRKCRPTSEVPMGLEAVSLHRPVCHF